MKTIQPHINIKIASSEEFYEVKHFLKKNQTYSASRGDIIYTVRVDKKLIGIARLLKIEDDLNSLWLRGLFIEDSWRNQGIASQLLLAIYQSQKNTEKIKQIFAFAEFHLDDFYKKNTYKLLEPTQLPISLQTRFFNAKEQRKKWLCLVKRV
jgi:N-acetylglutamate synthase-like GNAT family acetyltransferase